MTSATTSVRPAAADDRARHPWVPAVGAVAGTLLAAKAGLIIGSRNAAGEGPMAALYLAGIAIGLVAAVGFGLRCRSVPARVVLTAGAPLLVLAWLTVLGEVVEPAVNTLTAAAYVRDEAAVGLLGVVLLAASYVGFRSDQRQRLPR